MRSLFGKRAEKKGGETRNRPPVAAPLSQLNEKNIHRRQRVVQHDNQNRFIPSIFELEFVQTNSNTTATIKSFFNPSALPHHRPNLPPYAIARVGGWKLVDWRISSRVRHCRWKFCQTAVKSAVFFLSVLSILTNNNVYNSCASIGPYFPPPILLSLTLLVWNLLQKLAHTVLRVFSKWIN